MNEDVTAGWVSLDDSDNDPAHFWTYLIAAMEPVVGEAGIEALDSFGFQERSPIEYVLTGLINELAARSAELVLILDDYHVIQSEEVHEGMRYLLDHMPDSTHIYLSTRGDPPLNLARFRGRGQLVEIGVDHLRFTSPESSRFLKETIGLNLANSEISALATRTEGWVAGLQLAPLAIRDRGDAGDVIASFSGSSKHVFDYLASETLDRQPPDVREFLLNTSILQRLGGDICDALTGRVDSQLVLESLERRSMFLFSLDDRRQWFRYHQIFREFLHDRLIAAGTQRLHDLHRLASAWCARNNLLPEAIDHSLAATDFEIAAPLVEQMALDTLIRGEGATLQKWLGSLPDDLVESRPKLAIARAWGLRFAVNVRAVERWLGAADRALDAVSKESGPPAGATGVSDTTELGSLRGQVAAIRAGLSVIQDSGPEAVEFCERALARLPEADVFFRAHVTFILGISLMRSDRAPEAAEAYLKAADLSQRAGTDAAAVPLAMLGYLQLHANRLRDSARELGRSLDMAKDAHGRLAPSAGVSHSLLGRIKHEWNDLDGAINHFDISIEIAHGFNWRPGDLAHSLLGRAHAQRSRGTMVDIESVLQATEDIFRNTNTFFYGDLIIAGQTRLLVDSGDLDRAARLTARQGITPNSVPIFHTEAPLIELARLLIAQGRADGSSAGPGKALALLDLLAVSATKGGLFGRLITVRMLSALAHQELEDIPGAMSSLEHSLSLARPEGNLRTFLDEGEPMFSLLREAASRAIVSEYCEFLLAAARTENGKAVSAAVSADLLSPRDIEVLRLIAAGLTNQQIADKLYLSLNTIRSHTKNAYSKLDVQSRTQAVARARDLRIL